jgi:hypothetical protein
MVSGMTTTEFCRILLVTHLGDDLRLSLELELCPSLSAGEGQSSRSPWDETLLRWREQDHRGGGDLAARDAVPHERM